MEIEFVLVAIIALLQVVMGAPPVEVSQSKMTLLEKETMTAVCRVGRPISYCRFFIPRVGGLNLSPSIRPDRGIEYYGAGLEGGECGVKITEVRKEYNGRVTCHLGFPTESLESTGEIQLVVAQPPSTPKLSVRPGQYGQYFKEGEKIQADCRVEGGRPVANISWFLGPDPITEGLSSPSYENGPEDLQTVSQSLTLPVKYTDHGKNLRCVANHIALSRSNINHSIHRLNINFPPKPKSSETEQFGFTIGQPGKVIVMFNANPRPKIHWEVGNERLTEGMKDSTRSFEAEVLDNKGSGTWAAVLNIAKVTAKDVEKKYTLVAENELGREAYKVAISTSPAPPADITAGAIAGIVVAVLVILLIIFILIFARAFGKWCFAGSKPRRPAGESKRNVPNIGSLTYKNYKPIETDDGRKVYVSPEDEKKIRLASKYSGSTEIFLESENQSKRRNSDSSGSMYETPVTSKTVPVKTVDPPKKDDSGGKTPNAFRNSFPFYGKKRRLFPEEAPLAKETEDELNLPPNIQQISSDDENEQKKTTPRMIFPDLFRKSKTAEVNRGKAEIAPDPLNEQIPVEVNIQGEDTVDKKTGKKGSIFGLFPKSKTPPSDESEIERKTSNETRSDETKTERRRSRDKPKVTLKSIFGIEDEGKKEEKRESFKEMQQKDSKMEDKILEFDNIPHVDDEKLTEFRSGGDAEEVKQPEVAEENGIKFPTSVPLSGRWGPKSRKVKAKSAPEMTSTDKEVKSDDDDGRPGILSTRLKKTRKGRPVSFADEPTVVNIGSDTESADHGSADKSSVSKLTEEKQQKKFLGQLLDSFKRKNKDKVADNEALRNLPVTIDKDIEQQMQKDHIQKDHLKTDGIVYAELDMARAQGHVVRRDDEKTEYAEIIHPKTADFKRSRDELRKSRENLSGSREHLTEDDSTTTTPDGKKEAAV